MRRLFLAAGIASLAIAAGAAAKPGGDHGGGGGNPHDGGGDRHGGGGGAPAFAPGGGNGGGNGGGHGGGGERAPVFMGGGGGHGRGGGPAPSLAPGDNGGHGRGGFAAPQVRAFEGGGGHGRGRGSFEAPQMPGYAGGGGHGRGRAGFEAPQMPAYAGGGGHGRGRGGFEAPQMRAYARGGGHGRGIERQQFRAFAGGNGHGRGQQAFAREQARSFAAEGRGRHGFAREQARAFAGGGRGQEGQSFAGQRGLRFERQQAQVNQRQQLRGNGIQPIEQQALSGGRFNGQQFAARNGMGGNPAQFVNQQPLYPQNWNGVSPYQSLTYGNNVQILPVQQVEQFLGAPVGNVAGYGALAPLPANIQYLYPDTPDYYYRWGDGYLYQVDRTDNLIASLVPLLAGGYLPGQYLPQPYMASYVPSDYGFNNFYPDYGDVCNRYYDGVIYQVDCSDGYVENVIPMYAGGYGVGQLIPSAYTYYNVPMQYRDLYYDTPDNGYWYAPGAIYQYDPRTSLITSVAALMSPGFSVGQPLPVGYDVYNVPYDYRATYYDTPDAWYRYSNGYIYQVDPVTQVVTTIVASLLT